MRKVQSIPQYFLRVMLRYAGLGLFLIFLISAGVSFVLTREQMSSDLQESATATAEAFRDRIFDGDIKSVELQIQQLLKVRDGESAQILRNDLSRVYDSFAPAGQVKPCPQTGVTCFNGFFGQARILVPISLSADGCPADRYLYLSKRIHWNWSYLATVFGVFALGYLGLLAAFLRVSKLASIRLGAEILDWSDKLRADPKSAAPTMEPPFTELQPLRQALQGLNAQIERFEKTATDKARLLLLRGIAHDLLTPVARLQLYIGTLESGIDQALHGETLEEIRDSLTAVTGIASQVKTLNDLDAPVEETELVAAAQQEVRALRDSKALAAKAIKLEYHSGLLNLVSPFSRTEITRILSNLVENAAAASAKGGIVNVEVGRADGAAFLEVRDSGSGIPAEAQQRVKPLAEQHEPGSVPGQSLKELRLKHWGEIMVRDLAEMPPTEQGIILKCISRWSQTEKSERRAQMIATKIRSSRFKRVQTVDAFDFSHSKATQGIQKTYLALHQSVAPASPPSAVFTGTAGMGKTHLARALGYAACQKGMSTLFTTAAEMVNQLSHAQKDYRLETELNRYRRPQVLIIDELGYVQLDAQASNLFFQVISARHDQGLGTIATTNLPFGKFNQIFANDAIAHAIVDRLVNEAEVFFMEGASYREHQKEQKQKSRAK